MKKIIFSTIIIAYILISCTSQKKNKVEGYGSLHGNVFWNYNKVLGNRPDAGCAVSLYSLPDTSFFRFATADVRGDFVFDSIPVGGYVVIVNSKAVTENPYDELQEIWMNGAALEAVTHSTFAKAIDSAHAQAEIIDSMATHETYKYNEKRTLEQARLADALRDSSFKIAIRGLHKIPTDAYEKIGLSGLSKIKVELVTIELNKVTSKVYDLGNTYY